MIGIANPEVIDALVRWGLRVPYWRQIFRETSTNECAVLIDHVQSRWRALNHRNSPSGQMPLSASKHLRIKTRAMHLASAYNAILYHATGTTDPLHPPAKSDYLALHDGFLSYTETVDHHPMVDINTVYQLILDAHLYRGYAMTPTISPRPPVLMEACANPVCPAYRLVYFYPKDLRVGCPFCECVPNEDEIRSPAKADAGDDSAWSLVRAHSGHECSEKGRGCPDSGQSTREMDEKYTKSRESVPKKDRSVPSLDPCVPDRDACCEITSIQERIA